MIPREQLKKIQKLHFKTRHLANDLFAGQYESAFKGQGMEFSEVREYQIGDDIKTIDWNVSARFGRPFVKVFHEERELTVMLLLDLSGSNLFGTRRRFKRELIAEVAGMLAFLAIRTNDKVGAILFTSEAEKFIPPQKGAAHVWRLIKEIFTYRPKNLTTSIDSALTYLNRVIKRHAIVFLISDFIDKGFEKSLRLSAKKHDLNVIIVSDPAEKTIPNVGLINARDPETGKICVINTGNRHLRQRLNNYIKEHKDYLAHIFKRTGVAWITLSTDGPVTGPIIRLFDAKKTGKTHR